MALEEKLLEMLSSDQPQVRCMALEQLRDSEGTSEAIVKALEKATHDENPEIAKIAIQALQNEVHNQMANKMGIIVLDQKVDDTISTIDQTTSSLSPKVETPKSSLYERASIDIPYPLTIPDWLQYCQAITFFFSLLALLTSIMENDSSEFIIGDGRIYILVIIIYFGIQLYAIRKFGFKESFKFLDKLIQFFFSRHR